MAETDPRLRNAAEFIHLRIPHTYEEVSKDAKCSV